MTRNPTGEGASPTLIVFALWLLVFSSASQTMIISPILPRIGEELGAYSIMVGAFAIISGPISDKVGRRRMLMMGAATMTVALSLHGFVAGYVSFLAVRVFAGMAGGMLSGAAVSYIGDWFPYHQRGWATGWVMSGSAFGQIIGIPLGIVMAERWGIRSPFYLFAVTMAATLVLLFLKVPQPEVRRTQHPLSIGKAVKDYMDMLRRPEVAWAAAAFFLMFLGISVYTVYLPTWLERDLGASGDQIALMFLLGGVANVVTGPKVGRLSDRIGRKGIILMSCLGLSLVMLMTVPLVTSLVAGYVVFFLFMVLVAMRISPFSALLTALVRDDRRGSLMSLTVALGQLGFALGGAVAGPLFAGAGYRANTLFGAAMVLGMALIVWFLIPEPAREEAHPAARS